MGNFFSQSFFIAKPTITEHNCADQRGRVFVVTGGYTGVGFELSRILFACNATVYIAGRSKPKASAAIAKIKQSHAQSSGRLEFLSLDLADLSTIKPAVELFTSKEQRLDVLVNNAGVMFPPVGSTTAQAHDLQIGTNCLGPYLLYKLLSPLLSRTAASSPTASVRVAWAGAVGIEVLSPRPGGMMMNSDGSPNTKDVTNDVIYAQSKVGNYYLAKELARSTPDTGIIHLSFNPGNLRTELQRHWTGAGAKVTVSHDWMVKQLLRVHSTVARHFLMGRKDFLLLYPASYGGYTELWAAIAPEITPEKSGAYVWPWGRFGGVRADVEAAVKSEEEGGTGMSKRFVEWCEDEVAAFI